MHVLYTCGIEGEGSVLGRVATAGVYHAVHDCWWQVSGQQAALDKKVVGQAQATLKQVGTSLSLTSTAAWYFEALPCTVLICQGVVVIGALLMALDIAKYALVRFSQGLCKHSPNRIKLGLLQRGACFNSINGLGCLGPNILFHESGHALSILPCFNTVPSIAVQPFCGGVTSFSAKQLTCFGLFLGPRYAMLLVTLGGILASLTVAMIDFALAHAWRETRPQCSLIVGFHGVSQLFNEIIYGVEALIDPVGQAHGDFMRAWQLGGVHPLLVLACLVAPLIEYLRSPNAFYPDNDR